MNNRFNFGGPDDSGDFNAKPGPELSIVVPTYNERENVLGMVKALSNCLDGLAWEVIFVDDDSPDSTSDLVRELSQQNHRLRCIQRIGRRGLSSACIEGMLASSSPYLAVIDGDLQHDESLIPQMLSILKTDQVDIVIGTRYADGGGVNDWKRSREAISRFSNTISRIVIKGDLSDPMSGFFMLRRETLENCVHSLSGLGFKILVDIFASSPKPLKFMEVPYQFRNRQMGESKLDTQVAWDFLMLLLDKLVGKYVPVRFIVFSLVGGSGVFVHFLVLYLMFKQASLSFVVSQSIATLTAMVSNFSLNNVFTYRDMRLRGWKWFKGLISFTIVCSIGASANIGVASYLFGQETKWAIASLAGILVGTVWNYVVTMVYTWKK